MTNRTRDASEISNRATSTRSVPVPIGRTLREQFIEMHGEILGETLYDIEMAGRRKAVERFQDLTNQAKGISAEMEAAMKAGNALLVPLQAAMDKAYAVWLSACNACEAQRIANQSALIPLTNQLHDLQREINRPLHEDRVRNWSGVDMPPAERGRGD